MTHGTYTPAHLQRWTRPSYYAGEDWSDYYLAAGHHRDSDLLTQSNWDAALRALGPESATVVIARSSHWAVGWIEQLFIHHTDAAKLEIADDLARQLSEYPILDEDDYSARQLDAATEAWNETDLPDRLAILARIGDDPAKTHLSLADMSGAATLIGKLVTDR